MNEEVEKGENDLVRDGQVETLTKIIDRDDGTKVKVTQKVKYVKKVRRVNRRIEERRNSWVKFGECKDAVGPEPGITETEPPIDFVLGNEDKRRFNLLTEKEQEEMENLYKNLIRTSTVWRPTSRTTGGVSSRQPPQNQNRRQNELPQRTPGKYVPPNIRNRIQGGGEPICALRVTNLPEDATKDDLINLFGRFGDISKVFLEREQRTNQAKGFAFIHFEQRSHAEAAFEELTRKKVGLNNLILNVEWAKPSRSNN